MLFRLLIGLISDITSFFFAGIGILIFIGVLLYDRDPLFYGITTAAILGLIVGIGKAVCKKNIEDPAAEALAKEREREREMFARCEQSPLYQAEKARRNAEAAQRQRTTD